MISDKLQQAKTNPEKDYHLKMDIRRVIRLIESDFYMVLTLIPGVSIQDEAFLIDALINFFEEKYAEAIHLAVPRLENVTGWIKVIITNRLTTTLLLEKRKVSTIIII